MIEVGMMVTHDSAQSAVNEHRTETFGPVGLVVSMTAGSIVKVMWCKSNVARNMSTRSIRVISQ